MGQVAGPAAVVLALAILLLWTARACDPAPSVVPKGAAPDTARVPVYTPPPVLPKARTFAVEPNNVTIPLRKEPKLHAATAARPLLAVARIEPHTLTLTHVDSSGEVLVRSYEAFDPIRHKEMRIDSSGVQLVNRTWAGRQLYRVKAQGPAFAVGTAAGTVLTILLLLLL